MVVKLTITYDGTEFCGWQKQTEQKSVQGEIESAIKKLTGKAVSVVGSGRTDAGVHAWGQVAHFEIHDCTIPAENFARALNTVLEDGVKVLKSQSAPDGFNARKSAKKKTYRYSFYISETQLPLEERFKTRIEKLPDLDKMKTLAGALKGEHDFKVFCASGSSVKSTVRTIYDIDIVQDGFGLYIEVSGNGFLYNMVRTIAGTLLEVGYGKKTAEQILTAVQKGDRKAIGKTLPAKGLCLQSVEY